MMSEKRFEVVLNEFDEVEYIMDKEMMEDRDFAEFMDFVEILAKVNEQLRTQLAICQQSKKDDGRFQVWEVPPIPRGKRISFTTNNDGGDGV